MRFHRGVSVRPHRVEATPDENPVARRLLEQ
jgi:hypothetical protein